MLKQYEQTLFKLITSGQGTYGVSIYYFETEEAFTYQADEEFYSASIIKVPIMAAVFAHAAEGKCSLSETIKIREEDIVPGDGILKNLSPRMEWTVYDLIVLMIIESDNTATNLLIELVGKENIGVHMKSWGFHISRLHHKLQISPDRKPDDSNVITPREINKFLIDMAFGRIVSINACRQMIDIMKQQKMNDLLPRLLPDTEGPIGRISNWELAHKTGYVSGIEHNVGLLYLPGNTFSVTVLSKNVPTREEPKEIIGKLGKWLYEKTLNESTI